MADLRTSDDDLGQIQIADEVIAIIAGTAALETEGVSGMAGNFTDIIEKLGKKNFSKGVRVSVEDGVVTVDLNLIIKFCLKIHEVALNVQKEVKTAIETMTGLSAGAVNIYVTGLDFGKERAKERIKNELE